jgi:hypothetical protein
MMTSHSCCTRPAQWREGAGENVKGERGRGKLLRGERKGDHAQGMLTHRRARLARGGGRATSVWVVLALRNGAEERGRMVKVKGGGAGCCAGSERATTRWACKRTAAQLVQDDAPAFGLYAPCEMARRCGREWLRGKGAGRAAARGAKGRPRAGHANAPPRNWCRLTRQPGCTCPAQWRGSERENG